MQRLGANICVNTTGCKINNYTCNCRCLMCVPAEKDKKGFRASLLMASLDHKAVLEFKERITRGTKILECYSTMQKIKVLTMTCGTCTSLRRSTLRKRHFFVHPVMQISMSFDVHESLLNFNVIENCSTYASVGMRRRRRPKTTSRTRLTACWRSARCAKSSSHRCLPWN